MAELTRELQALSHQDQAETHEHIQRRLRAAGFEIRPYGQVLVASALRMDKARIDRLLDALVQTYEGLDHRPIVTFDGATQTFLIPLIRPLRLENVPQEEA